ncbi:MAG TPA: S41 family peptidase [Pyrinomonadaceae bacterium]|nr:S41 family peptidase [Pyrinomonadaceae bacterium]
MKQTFSRILFAVLALQLSLAAAFGQAPATAVEFPKVRQDAFDKVWNTVNEKHYDPEFGGVDWIHVRELYLPKAKAAKSDQEFHNVLRQMLGELKLSHFNVFPPPPAIGKENDSNASVGVELKWIGNAPVVFRVTPGSPAEIAGIKPGFVLSKADGKLVSETLKPIQESLAKRQVTEMMRRLYLERNAEAIIGGKPETKVALEFLDGEDKPISVELARVKYTGEMSQALGNFPKQRVIFESRLLPENIGYIRFNMWVIPQAGKIRAAIREYAKADGIIIDLRGNPGGVGGLAGGVAGLLSDKQISLGTMTSRAGTMSLLGYPQPDPFLKKIVVLTDHGSGSTSEMFAAGIQENGRGKVIGETSAGAILLSVFDPLPTGYMFQYAISDYKSPKNILIEGRGVKPDREVGLTRESLLAGRDVQLDAAIAEIRKN